MLPHPVLDITVDPGSAMVLILLSIIPVIAFCASCRKCITKGVAAGAVKGTSNELFGEMVETIQNLVAQTRYPLYVDYLDEDSNEVLRAIQLCWEKKPLGIIFLGGNTWNFQKDFGKIDMPCVPVSNSGASLPFQNLPQLSTVQQSVKQRAKRSVEILIDRMENGGAGCHETVSYTLHQRESTRRLDG